VLLGLQWCLKWYFDYVGKRVVKKIDECVGDFTLAITFRNVERSFYLGFCGCLWP
jgi:hypothetical protein